MAGSHDSEIMKNEWWVNGDLGGVLVAGAPARRAYVTIRTRIAGPDAFETSRQKAGPPVKD
ncbi:hypothetical protein KIN20_018004 [Parelaphostrongylus tenuis]|uniref:Uncharacterized protein n=1 Tax=Parelaphostrongylus tenuis TaxID=148309 RepID=A0AAD5N343_PARTN|nr:hypothetical protein KIN20_018004 [Parelaphostrongylus tenuis]